MKNIALFLFLLLSVRGFSQELLANGSFEDKNMCTEYNKDCAPEAWLCNWLG
ncbi:MAG: hypothetical protein JST39_24420, partial [Bacteroidetes bacterium]|nr:hypothetical protein [Bacteroidota bacterium]